MRVCVFCGSAPGARPVYLAAARALGEQLARGGHELVYGGASVGTMGAVADAALAAGGRVVGVIPRSLREREIAHLGLAELVVVETLAARKDEMFSRADAFVSLPGGFGTLDETFEVLTLQQIGGVVKPVVLVDLEGFYAPLVAFLDRATTEGLVQPAHRAFVTVVPDVPAAIAALGAHRSG